LLSNITLNSMHFGEALRSEKPDRLHHYTNQAGLLGLFNTGELWATKIPYMNDATEFEYSLGLARNALLTRHWFISSKIINWLSAHVEKRQCDLLQWVANYVDTISAANICSVSFCTDSDLLSQWRGYAGLSVGYSIGFYTEGIVEIAQNNACRLARCIYEKTFQEQIINELIDEALEKAKVCWDDKLSVDETHLAVGSAFQKALLECGAFFKDASFKEEQEWRIITAPRLFTEEAFCFKEGKSMLTPYCALKIRSDESWTNKIAGVMVGPCPHPKSSKAAVEGLLMKRMGVQHEHPLPPVTCSKIPYRSW
jgi:Protein of unknown function (DUF2971)